MLFFHVQAIVSSLGFHTNINLRPLSKYQILTLFFSWFALANLWLTFTTIIDLAPDLNIPVFNENNLSTVRILC
jgi:hypothetical protein